MDAVRIHGAVATKVKAMESKLLSDDDYINLLNMKSISQCARYLKVKTGYGRFLADVDVDTIHRGELEGRIKKNIIYNIDKIIHYYSGSYKEFINTFYAKYEIDDLKDLAREVYKKGRIENYQDNVFIGKYSKAEPSRILAAKSVRDIIIALKDTVLEKYTMPLIDDNRRENLFRFEMALDMAYYNILQKEWDKLSHEDQKTIRYVFGTIGDVLNIQWVYRGKKFYDIEPQVLLNYTIKLYNRLNYKKIKELCYQRSLSEFLHKARQTPYGFLFKNDETIDIYMDRRMHRYIYYHLQKIDRTTSMNIINVVAYILFLEFEARDIISIIEIIRYGVPEEQGKKYLIKNIH